MLPQDDFNGWQMSLFGGLLKEVCDTKPEVGTRLVMHYEGKDYPCVVTNHIGFDFFYVKFVNAKPQDDNRDLSESDGWHLSLRGYMKDWDYPEETL